jgi:hypothetical protein
MKENHIESLAVWAGFFKTRLNYRLSIQKLKAAIAKVRVADKRKPQTKKPR